MDRENISIIRIKEKRCEDLKIELVTTTKQPSQQNIAILFQLSEVCG